MKKPLSTIITIAFCLNLSGHSSCFIDKSNMIYENNVLIKILIDGGYITFNDTIPEYHYYLKDHLGNNRVVVKIDGTVLMHMLNTTLKTILEIRTTVF